MKHLFLVPFYTVVGVCFIVSVAAAMIVTSPWILWDMLHSKDDGHNGKAMSEYYKNFDYDVHWKRYQ